MIFLNLFEHTITDIMFCSLLSISILFCIYIITHHEKEIDKTRYLIPILLVIIFLHSFYVVRAENKSIRKLTHNERAAISIFGTPPRKKIYTDCATKGVLEYLYAYRYDNVIVDFMNTSVKDFSDCYIIINLENLVELNKFYGTNIPDFVKNPPDTWKITKKFTTPKGGSYIIMQAGKL